MCMSGISHLELGHSIIEQFLFHVIEGIRWYERNKELIEQHKVKPLRTGGIARD